MTFLQFVDRHWSDISSGIALALILAYCAVVARQR